MIARPKQLLQYAPVVLAAGLWLTANDRLGANSPSRGGRTHTIYGEAGLTPIYKGTMEINGETAQLEVFTAVDDLSVVVRRFASAARERFKHAWFDIEETGAFGFVQHQDRLSRFYFEQIEDRQTLLYALHQSYPAPVASSRNVLPLDFPVYPGASLDIAVHHRETGTRLATYSAGGVSAVVLDYYQMTLTQNGWQQLGRPLRDERTVEAAAQVAFRKGDRHCVISCEPSAETGALTIVVLLKDSNP
jgi:hypothetical protein